LSDFKLKQKDGIKIFVDTQVAIAIFHNYVFYGKLNISISSYFSLENETWCFAIYKTCMLVV